MRVFTVTADYHDKSLSFSLDFRFLQKTLDDLEEFRHKHQILEEQQKELLSHKQQVPTKLNIHIPDHLQMRILENGENKN